MNTKKIKKQIYKHSLISFDIFDTLLVRPYVKPTDLFLHIGQLYNYPKFYEERINTENELRRINKKEEITLDQIYSKLNKKYSPLKEKELELEYQTICPNYKIKPIYELAVKKNKKIIITSDIYLPKKFLEKLLKKNGFFGYKEIYASSDLMKTKYTGSMYEHIISENEKEKIIHIGDNYNSDFINPQKYGIDAIHIDKLIDLFFQKNENFSQLYINNPKNIGISIILGILSLQKTDNNNYWENFGKTYAGPVILSYVKWLDKEFKKDKITDALFIARDGYSLKKVFEDIKTSSVKSHYVYAPRKLNSICNLDYSKQPNKLSYIKSIISYFGDRLSLKTTQINSIAEGVKILNKNKKKIKKLANYKKKSYQTYLSSLTIKGERIGVIDTITGFFSAQKLITTTLNNKKNYGYYWDIVNKEISRTSKYRYSTFHQQNQCNIQSWELIEFMITSPEPPIEDIINNKPIYKTPSKHEKKRNIIYKFIYKGILDFSNTTKQIFKHLDLSIKEDDIAQFINTFLLHPQNKDIKMFKQIKYSNDIDHNQYEPLIKLTKKISNETLLQQESNEIRSHINELLTNKWQIQYLLFINKLLSIVVFWKNGIKYHQNVWYLQKRLDLLNKKQVFTPTIQNFKQTSIIAKKWQKEVFNKKANKKIDINHLDIAFIIPAPIKGSGGHRNFFRAIKFLKNLGHKMTVYYTQTNENAEIVRNNISKWFYKMSGIPYIKYEGETGYHDVGICTWWETAYDIQKNINKIKFPFYFVQDFEPMFYPIGSEYTLAENSYKLGFFHICSGPWCKDFLINKYHADAEYFQFPIDKKKYNTNQPRTKKNKNIIFFAKPDLPRRCYELGIKALEKFHKLKPDIEIITFGSNYVNPSIIPFKVTCLGLLPTTKDLADLYRNADFGLVFSTTNPSLVPYEMMSCDCPVGDLDLDLALSKYGNSKNNVFLLNPIPEKMGQQLADIFDNPKEMEKKAKSGKNFVEKEFPTEEEMGKIVENIIKQKILSTKNKKKPSQ